MSRKLTFITAPSKENASKLVSVLGLAFVLVFVSFEASAQNAVSELITDYNGYWKSSATAINNVKPDNHHNLLAFTFNGIRYSTGVNDAALNTNNDNFTAADFRALPMQNITGVPIGNTKIGLGAMIDGVYNGPGATPPSRNLPQYLNDGTNGLDMGTCVANLPVGTLFLSASNLQAGNIGDGVPDILVTQVADPSTKFDRYEFTDINGNRVGNYLDVVLTNITPIGNWVADFYESTGTSILTSGFTQTQRAIRLWAADFSVFGINSSNIANIAYFKITLSGDSDIAFVAYNTKTVTIQQVLALPTEAERRKPSRSTNSDDVKTFSAYPNPAVGIINFTHAKAIGDEKIFIYNMQGVKMLETAVAKGSTKAALNISSLKSGSYQAVYTNGTEKSSQMVVIK
ncbi:MAG: T9SS type A sorting domain-containing protein [Flavitalea sp.]